MKKCKVKDKEQCKHISKVRKINSKEIVDWCDKNNQLCEKDENQKREETEKHDI